jgi:hypothetical protein
MKYYRKNSIPLEEVELSIGERGYDENGNYIEVNIIGEPHIIKKSVLKDGELISSYANENFLKAFWAMSGYNGKLEEDEL